MSHLTWLSYSYQICELIAMVIWCVQLTLCPLISGGNAPSYVYRLIGELYDPDDSDL